MKLEERVKCNLFQTERDREMFGHGWRQALEAVREKANDRYEEFEDCPGCFYLREEDVEQILKELGE